MIAIRALQDSTGPRGVRHSPVIGHIGLGANLGRPAPSHLRGGLEAWSGVGLRCWPISSVWETEPVDSPGGAPGS